VILSFLLIASLQAAHGPEKDEVGTRIAPLNDVDGDHCADFAIDDGWGSVWVISGKSGKAIARISDGDGVEVKNRIAPLFGDVDGDGAWDIIVLRTRCVLELRSGKDLHLIRGLPLPDGIEKTYSVPAPAGDWNQDGVPDVAVGGRRNGVPTIAILSGKEGHEIDSIGCEAALSSELFANRGSIVIVSSCRAGDMRPASFVLPVGHPERTLLVPHGATPIVLPSCEHDRERWVNHDVGFVGDIDGDGVPDLALATFMDGSKEYVSDMPRSALISGKTGKELRLLSWNAGFDGGFAATRIADLDGDGVEEILIGIASWPEGLAQIRSGKDLSVLWTLPQRASWCSEEGRFAASVAALGDVDGDGIADFAIGSSTGIGGLDPGCVNIFSGGTRQRLWTIWRSDLFPRPSPSREETKPK
jgi:hypothetical protein